MKKKKFVINFEYFIKHEMVLMQKVISCVVVFFILISMINISKIEVEVELVKEGVGEAMKVVGGQVRDICGVSNISRIYIGRIFRVFVKADEVEELKEQRARGEVEKIIAKEIMLLGARYIGGEGARGGDRGEGAGEGNSLMASVGYMMLADIYEIERGIKEGKIEGDRYSVWEGIIERYIEEVNGGKLKGGSVSLGRGEIRKEKEEMLLLAKELSMIDLRDNNILTGKKEVIRNKIKKRLSL